MSNIFKVNVKTTEQRLMLLLLTLNIFPLHSTVTITEFEQILVGLTER